MIFGCWVWTLWLVELLKFKNHSTWTLPEPFDQIFSIKLNCLRHRDFLLSTYGRRVPTLTGNRFRHKASNTQTLHTNTGVHFGNLRKIHISYTTVTSLDSFLLLRRLLLLPPFLAGAVKMTLFHHFLFELQVWALPVRYFIQTTATENRCYHQCVQECVQGCHVQGLLFYKRIKEIIADICIYIVSTKTLLPFYWFLSKLL